MFVEFWGFIGSIGKTAINMINSSSVWMCISLVIAGVLHEFLSPEKMRKTSIGSTKLSGVFYATISGMLIPICSCGTIPLGISMYY